MEPNEETGAAQAAALPTDPPDPNDNGSPLGGPGKQIPAIALGVNVDEPQSPMGHKVILTKDESGWIVAECPELPGCVSQGRDEAEALANIREAIQVLTVSTMKGVDTNFTTQDLTLTIDELSERYLKPAIAGWLCAQN